MRINYYAGISLLIILLGVTAACSDKTDLDKLRLNGEVASLTESNFLAEYDDGEWEKIELLDSSKIYFDKNGWQQSAKNYDGEGNLTQETVIIRKDGKVTKRSIFNDEGDLIMKDEYLYNAGDTVKTITYNATGEIVLRVSSLYDDELMVKQIATNIKDGEEDSQFIIDYEYDNQGNEIYKEWSNKDMEQFSIVKSEYDNKRNLLYKDVNEVALKSTSQTEYEYLSFDFKDNWTKRLEHVSYIDDEEKGEYTILSNRSIKYH